MRNYRVRPDGPLLAKVLLLLAGLFVAAIMMKAIISILAAALILAALAFGLVAVLQALNQRNRRF